MTDEEGNQLIISGPPQAPFDTNICLQELLLTTLRKHNVKSIAQVVHFFILRLFADIFFKKSSIIIPCFNVFNKIF